MAKIDSLGRVVGSGIGVGGAAMITCEAFMQLQSRGCLSCTNAERAAWLVHKRACPDCSKHVNDLADKYNATASDEEKRLIRNLAAQVALSMQEDEECRSITDDL